MSDYCHDDCKRCEWDGHLWDDKRSVTRPKFCPNCGTALLPDGETEEMVPKAVAIETLRDAARKSRERERKRVVKRYRRVAEKLRNYGWRCKHAAESLAHSLSEERRRRIAAENPYGIIGIGPSTPSATELLRRAGL